MKVYISKFIILLLVFFSTKNFAQQNKKDGRNFPNLEESQLALIELDTDELKDYNDEANRKVKAFGTYLELITNPKIGKEEKQEVFELAADLFLHKKNTIQSSDSTKYFILNYLQKISTNSNNSGIIKWSMFQSSGIFDYDSCQKNIYIEELQTTKDLLENDLILSRDEKNVQVFLTFKCKMIYDKIDKRLRVSIGNIELSKK